MKGIIAAPPTPRRDGTEEIDQGALWDLVDFVQHPGLAGLALFAAGMDYLHFPIAERLHVIGLAVKRSRLPVWVHASHSTLDAAVELASEAAASGAAGVLLCPPMGLHPESTILHFFRTFRREIDHDLPIALYQDQLSSQLREVLLAENLVQLNPTLDEASLLAAAVPELAASLGTSDLATQRWSELLTAANLAGVPGASQAALRHRPLRTGPPAIPPDPETEAAIQQFLAWFEPWIKQLTRDLRR